jgi:hypothetical protein
MEKGMVKEKMMKGKVIEQAKIQRRDILWYPREHNFFKNTKEMNDDCFSNMFTCYEKGLKRLNDLLYQEVYKKIPHSTVGR